MNEEKGEILLKRTDRHVTSLDSPISVVHGRMMSCFTVFTSPTHNIKNGFVCGKGDRGITTEDITVCARFQCPLSSSVISVIPEAEALEMTRG
jgi:hypothetical protein